MLRTVPLLISAFLLTACVTKAPSDVVLPAAAAPAAPATAQTAPAGQPAAQATPAPARPLPAGRAARAPEPAAPAASADNAPMTINKAREECWMKSETNNAIRNDLDKKVKFVEQCVNEKMK